MIEEKISQTYLESFLSNLRYEDEIELSKSDINLNDFFKICLDENNKTYFLTINNLPLALGGVFRFKNDDYKVGQVWLLTTKYIQGNKIKLYKYVTDKIESFKKEYDILFNYIYKSNFESLKWLKKCGFRVIQSNNPDFRLFYFCKGGMDFDLRYIAG